MYCDRYLEDSITMSPREKSVCAVGVVKLQLDRVDDHNPPRGEKEINLIRSCDASCDLYFTPFFFKRERERKRGRGGTRKTTSRA